MSENSTRPSDPFVFVSYARIDCDDNLEFLITNLELEVRRQLGQQVPFWMDRRNIRTGQDFADEIDHAIDTVLLFLPIMTPSYFGSDYCKKELTRFLQREAELGRKDLVMPLYYIDQKLLNDTKQLAMPEHKLEAAIMRHNVCDWRQFRFTDKKDPQFLRSVSDLATSFVEAIKRAEPRGGTQRGEDNDSSLEDIRVVLNEIRTRIESTKFRRPFKTALAAKVLTAARDEIQLLTGSGEYRQDLSIEQNFIVRAGPIFEGASQIYAISIDRFSEFWIAEDQRGRAEEYTSHQPKNTMRLFVFSSVKKAQQYRYVLAAHYQRYGQSGAVLLASREAHKNFLAEIDIRRIPELENKDFAILKFADPTSKGQGYGREEFEYYEATLSETKLILQQRNNVSEYRQLIDAFEDIRANLEEGQANKTGVLRWHKDFKVNDIQWGAALSRMFGLGDSGDLTLRSIYHVVFLSTKGDHAGLERYVDQIVRPKFDDLKSTKSGEKLVEDFWFGSRNSFIQSVNVMDGKYGGGLITANSFNANYPFCIVIRLKSVEDLIEYYRHGKHSEIRRDLLSLCDPKIADIYKLLDVPGRLSKDEERSIYDAIEQAASSLLIRADFQESSSRGILQMIPVEFQLPAGK